MAIGLSLVAVGALRGNDMLFILPGFVLFNTMMNAGPNLCTYTIPSEVFPVRLRASGHGFATSCGKLGATAGVLFFPLLQESIGLIATLGIVAGFALVGAAVTYFFASAGTTWQERQGRLGLVVGHAWPGLVIHVEEQVHRGGSGSRHGV